jgi:hypothetical protein
MIIAALLLGVYADGAEAQVDTQVPDFAGLWARQTFGLEAPLSGRGPIGPLASGVAGNTGSAGDYTDPLLKPQAAEIVKQRGERLRAGLLFPNVSNQCYPYPPPFILAVNQAVEFAQLKNEVVILAMFDNQIRRVRLNARHPASVTPSGYGDSIGHYEGDTLVVDTVGIRVVPFAAVEGRFGTPYSAALHVVERYRLIDYQAAKEAAERGEKQGGLVPGDSATGDGVGVDPDYRGKGLQVEILIDDEGVFTAPWKALVTYRRAAGNWVERICAENMREFGVERKPPRAETSDF